MVLYVSVMQVCKEFFPHLSVGFVIISALGPYHDIHVFFTAREAAVFFFRHALFPLTRLPPQSREEHEGG